MDKIKLREIRDNLDIYIGASENWANSYFVHDEEFKTLLLNKAKLERIFKNYFHHISPKLISKVEWSKYDVVTADESDEEWMDEENFTSEVATQQADLLTNLSDVITAMIVAGILSAKSDAPKKVTLLQNKLNQMGKSDLTSYIQNAADTRAAELVTQIDDTTRQRINNTVSQAYKDGKSIDELRSDLSSVIDNPDRAQLIAHTESVNSYSHGRREYAVDSGAVTHSWETESGKPCPECLDCESDGEIPIDQSFGPGWDSPEQSHPACYCIVAYQYNVD